jgi:hypothetical protein
MDHRVEEIDDESDDQRQQHVQGHVPVPSSLVAVVAGSRFRFGPDHALRKENQSGQQAKEANQEKKHEDDRKHFAPLGLS